MSNYKPQITQMKKLLDSQDYVLLAYLYGSVARGEAHKFSDIDIAVYLKDPVMDTYKKLLAKVAPFDTKDIIIDVRLLNNAPPLFRYNVIREGVLLVNKDENFRTLFVYKTLTEALDIKESIKHYRKERVEAFLNAI